METSRQSQIFDINQTFWTIFGIWPGNIQMKYYKPFSILFISITTVLYNVLLTLNLIYTPRNLEAMIQEFIFFFTEIAVMSKVVMVLVMREKILAIFKLIDCKEFQGNDFIGREIIAKNNTMYIRFWKACALVSNFSFCFVMLPNILQFVWKGEADFPICKYYFLSDDLKERYFWMWFVYQAIGIYCHMTYNINVDSFVAGVILIAISQLKVLNHNFSQLSEKNNSALADSKTNIVTLNKLLHHYDIILKYCHDIQEVLSMVMFVQFCMASVIICVAMCGLLMVSSTSVFFYGMVSYLCIMTMQIFVPGWLGTQLDYESQDLMHAAYNCDWIPQSASFKSSIRLFLSRAYTPIVIKGLKIFPLSLKTFISIMKLAYSFFALLRKLQDRQV